MKYLHSGKQNIRLVLNIFVYAASYSHNILFYLDAVDVSAIIPDSVL